jgi:glycosyltransferase involved in cell wall biosynthesis
MKIVRVIARLNVGGPARHVVWLTEGLQNAECESLLVTGVVAPGEDDMSYFAAERQVKPHVIAEMSREISPKDAFTILKLYRLLLRQRPDLIHTHTAKAGTVGRIAGLLYRWLTPGALIGRPRPCRLVHTYHGHIFHSYYGKLRTRLFLTIERVLARIATDRIIVISPQQYREIHEVYGVGRREQFAVIPLGLDTSLFVDWRGHRGFLREELQAKSEDVLVGIIGRLTEIKNHRLFLEAAAQYKKRHGVELDSGGRVRFLILGDGNLRATLEEQARSLGLQEDVIFLGTRNDPENFYPALDVVALTSLNEGTPLTIIEAMASERACVATAVGGVVDLLGATAEGPKDTSYEMGERGLLVNSNDVEGFSRALAVVIQNEGLRAELGARGRCFVEEKYSKEQLLFNVMSLYRGLMHEDSRGLETKHVEGVSKTL